jgi:hypothetical protein
MTSKADKNIRETKNVLQKTFEAFLTMDKREIISNPTKLVPTNMTIPDFMIEVIGAKYNTISFTRLSLKHLVEKGQEGQRLLDLAPHILGNPDEVRRGSKIDRFLVSKTFQGLKKNRPHTINLEITKMDGTIVVTAFQSKFGYLKNFELLWRTAGDI